MALLPDFWWPFGPTVTLTQVSDPVFRELGPYSARIQGNAEIPPDPDASPPVPWARADGITTSPFRIDPSAEFPHFSAEYKLKVSAGKVRAQIWDVTGPVAGDSTRPLVVWPSREAAERGTTDRLNVWIEDLFIEFFEDMWRGGAGEESTHLQLALLCEDALTDFHLDAGQCVNWGEAARIFHNGRAANDLFAETVKELERVGYPISTWVSSALDLARTDDVVYPSEGFTEGGDTLIVAPDLGQEVTRRVLSVTDNPIDNTPSSITLETNVQTITRLQAQKAFKRRQTQRPLPVPVPESIPDAVARLTSDQLQIRVLPVPGMHKVQFRVQGPGATPDERWESGEIYASELGTTVEISTDQIPNTRPLPITVKSLGTTGLESSTPFELDVEEAAATGSQRLPIDQDLVLYWPLEEQGVPTLPPQCSPVDPNRVRDDAGPMGNHGYLYSWDFGAPAPPGPGASGYGIDFGDPLGVNFPSAQVVVDSNPALQAAAVVPDDQGDFDTCIGITICAAVRPWIQDIDDCSHTHYDLWGRSAPGGGPINGHVFELAGFYFGLTEYQDTVVGFQPGLRMNYNEDVGSPVGKSILWPFDWSYGHLDTLRGTGPVAELMDTWIFVCQRIKDDGAGGIDVDVFVGDLQTTVLTKLDPGSLIQSDFASAYGITPVKDLTLKTTRWTFLGKGQTAEDRETCSISNDGWFGDADEHRRWNRELSDAEVYGQFLDLSGQKPADQIFRVP